MGASLNDTGGDLSAESLEVGALAGKIIETSATVVGVQAEEAVIGAGRDGSDGTARAGGGNGGDGAGDARSTNGGGIGRGDTKAAAGSRVRRAVIAGRGVCRDSSGGGGDLADLDGAGNNLFTRAAGGLRDEGGHGAGAISRQS